MNLLLLITKGTKTFIEQTKNQNHKKHFASERTNEQTQSFLILLYY